MSGVRVLVGTRKGAFVLTADGKRDQWEVSPAERRALDQTRSSGPIHRASL